MIGERVCKFKFADLVGVDRYGNKEYNYSMERSLVVLIEQYSVKDGGLNDGKTEFFKGATQLVHITKSDISTYNFENCLIKIGNIWYKNVGSFIEIYDSPLKFGGFFVCEKVEEVE